MNDLLSFSIFMMAAKLLPQEGAPFFPLPSPLSPSVVPELEGPTELGESDTEEEQHVLSLYSLHRAGVVSVNVSSGPDFASSRCRYVSFLNDDSLPGKLSLEMNGSFRW